MPESSPSTHSPGPASVAAEPRLQQRVLLVRLAGLLRPLVRDERLDPPAREARPQLRQLVRVLRREPRAPRQRRHLHRDHVLEVGDARDELLVDLAFEVERDDAPVGLVVDLERAHLAELRRAAASRSSPERSSTTSRRSAGRSGSSARYASDAQRPEREHGERRPDHGGPVVAGAGRHPDRGDDPEARRGREPRTESPERMIAPAPRKPMPVTICAAIRVGSTGDPSARRTPRSRTPRRS